MFFPYSFWDTKSWYNRINTGAIVIDIPNQLTGGNSQIVAYYKLNNEQFTDEINSINLNWINQPQFLSGINNLGFNCTGNNGAYYYPISQNTPKYNAPGDKTFVFWHKSLSPSPGGINALTENIFYLTNNSDLVNGNTAGTGTGCIFLYFYSQPSNSSLDKRINCQLHVSGGSQTLVTTSVSGSTGNFQFIALTINYNTRTLTLQLDNNRLNSIIWNSNVSPIIVPTGNIFIGGSSNQFYRQYSPVNGIGDNYIIDEIGIWNRVLNSGELTYLYNNGNGRTYPFT